MPMTSEELFQAKKADLKAQRRERPEQGAALTMTSLMDMITIIVCYLLKTYGSDPVVITPTAGQKIPMSRADTPIQDGVPVYISPRAISAFDKKIVQLDDAGEIDPAALQGHLIGPLYDLLAEEADKGKQFAEGQNEEWPGRIILIGDQNLKFSVLVDVMYTAGRAEYREYAFCIIIKDG